MLYFFVLGFQVHATTSINLDCIIVPTPFLFSLSDYYYHPWLSGNGGIVLPLLLIWNYFAAFVLWSSLEWERTFLFQVSIPKLFHEGGEECNYKYRVLVVCIRKTASFPAQHSDHEPNTGAIDGMQTTRCWRISFCGNFLLSELYNVC